MSYINIGIIGKLKESVRKKGFFQNVLIVLSGILIARLLVIIASPFLTRLYDPKLFGKLGVVVSLSNIFCSIASFKIELAFPILTSEEKKNKLWQLCLRAISIFMLLAIAFIFLVRHVLSVKYQLGWVELISILFITFFSGISEIYRYYYISYRKYKPISTSEVLKSIGQAFVPFLFAFAKLMSIGLVISELSGRFFALLNYLRRDARKLRLVFNNNSDKEFVREHAILDYVRFSMFAKLLNSISIESVPILMGYFFGLKFLGFFSLAQRIIALPVNLLGRSITDAFYGEASLLYVSRKYRELQQLLFKIVYRLFLLSVVPSILLYFFSEKLFITFFGNDWAESGQIVKLLIPFFTFQLAVAPISQIFNVINKQKYVFLWDSIRFVFSVLLLAFFSHYYNNAYYSVLYFSVTMSIIYISVCLHCFFELKKLVAQA